ncbi:MAG: hypothetical protein GDA50_07465 [Alphaproteobacteria bacterium GM202ARS2]|nr:hypothetical protein [Alphaproteobacteria bacterium GM202ARS2]
MTEKQSATPAIDRLVDDFHAHNAETDRFRKFVYHNRKIDPQNPLYEGDELRKAFRRLNRLYEAGYGKKPGAYSAIDGGIYLGHPDKERSPLYVDCFGDVFICDVNDAGQFIRTEGVIDDGEDFSEFIQGSRESLKAWRKSERDMPWWRRSFPVTQGQLAAVVATLFFMSWLMS